MIVCREVAPPGAIFSHARRTWAAMYGRETDLGGPVPAGPARTGPPYVVIGGIGMVIGARQPMLT